MSFLFIGHRGTRVSFDENTIGAFIAAIKAGANYIEFDVRKTRDGNLIIFHDDTLNRMTKNSGKIEDLALSRIRNLRTYKQKESIPQLKEILMNFKDRVNFMIELKSKGIQQKVIGIIKKKNLINQSTISGRDYKSLIQLKTENPEIQICYNITKGEGLTLEDFLSYNIKRTDISHLAMISLRSSQISQRFIDTCHNLGVRALAWDFIDRHEPVNDIKELILMGIDGILFDNYQNIPLVKRWMEENFN
jgi:glycerophosphoryl diester phosphodiesterase